MKKVGKVVAVVGLVAVLTVTIWGTVAGWEVFDRFWPWLDGFVRTPGIAGVGALTAAVVAYATAAGRIRHDRSVEDARVANDRDKEERLRRAELEALQRTQRWEVLMWVYENINSGDPDRMLYICQELGKEVKEELEIRMLAAIVEYRLDAPEAVADDSDQTEGESDERRPARGRHRQTRPS